MSAEAPNKISPPMSFRRIPTSTRVEHFCFCGDETFVPHGACRRTPRSSTMNPRMRIPLAASRVRQIFASLALFSLVFCQSAAPAQQQPAQQQPAQQQSQQQQTQPNQQDQQQPDQASPDAGGPSGDNGAIAIPKKKESETAPPPPPPPEPKVKNPPGLQNFSLRVDVPVVNVDVGVILEKTHQFVPNLQKDNFRVYEDGKRAGHHELSANSGADYGCPAGRVRRQ